MISSICPLLNLPGIENINIAKYLGIFGFVEILLHLSAALSTSLGKTFFVYQNILF